MSFFIFSPIASAGESKMIIINKGTNQLGYYVGGVLQKVFPVATGRSRSFTPEGKFTVINKYVNPPYYKKNIPGGSPYNPLGIRWLGLSAAGGPYGIHGNSNPSSIGTYASLGCVRMHNQDVLWLYDQIPIGTPVIITYNKIDLTSGFIDSKPIKVYLNKDVILTPTGYKTFSKQNKPYIPLKWICETLGYSLVWNSQTDTVSITQPDFAATMIPNSKSATINMQAFTLEDPLLEVEGTSYVTESTLKQIFGVDVLWKQQSRELYITKDIPELAPNELVTTTEQVAEPNIQQDQQSKQYNK